jgi:hypothetical protein
MNDDEEIPKWMKYLPRKYLKSNITKPVESSQQENFDHRRNTNENTKKKLVVKMKTSSNPFAPGSQRGLLEERLRKKRSVIIPVEDSIEQTPVDRKIKRVKYQSHQSSNIEEVGLLLSFHKIK